MIAPGAQARPVFGPVTGARIAEAGGAPLDTQAMLDWARNTGGPALRAMTFHELAKMLKALASYIAARKEELYALNPLTGATRRDGAVGSTSQIFLASSRKVRPRKGGLPVSIS